MEDFYTRSLKTAENPSRLWKRDVDDNFSMQRIEHEQNILQHINSIEAIIFTVEDA